MFIYNTAENSISSHKQFNSNKKNSESAKGTTTQGNYSKKIKSSVLRKDNVNFLKNLGFKVNKH